jgi:hypothetical protein
MGQLDKMDYEKVRAELMPRADAVVSEDGILFERMYYSCPEAKARGWLVDGRRRRKPLEIAFDYRLVDEIIVYSPDQKGESFVAKLTGDSVKFSGMSYKEVERHFRRVSALSTGSTEDKRQALFEHRSRTKSDADRAVKEVKQATVGVSRSSRRADTAEARREELKRERERTAGVQPPPTTAPTPTPEPLAPAREASSPVPPSAVTKAQVIPLQRGASSGSTPKADAPAAATTGEGTTLSQRLAALRRNLLS